MEDIGATRVNLGLHISNDLENGASSEKLNNKEVIVMSEEICVTASKNVKKGERYLPSFKNKVVTYALDRTIKAAAEKYKVSRGTVAEWLKENRKPVDGRSSIYRKENQLQVNMKVFN